MNRSLALQIGKAILEQVTAVLRDIYRGNKSRLVQPLRGSNVDFIAVQIMASRQLANRTRYDQAIE